jgi:hypothetical protein
VFRIVVFAAMVFIAAFPPVRAQEAGVIASMDETQFAPPKEKGSASLVDGRVGRAVRFRFEADSPSTFFTGNIHGKPEWDHALGFSFWVRGNGSDGFGGLEFIYGTDNPDPLFVHDRVHLGKAGHALVAETVLEAIEQEQKETVTKRSATP